MVYARTLNGFSGNNTLTGDSRNEQINGLGGNDIISGAGGSDRLDGGIGNDTLNGGDGDDILIGGAGNDSLTGGAGADVFMFGPGAGADTVVDFQVGIDRLDVSAFGGDFSAIQSGVSTLLTFSDGSTVILLNVQANQLGGVAGMSGAPTGGPAVSATAMMPPSPPPSSSSPPALPDLAPGSTAPLEGARLQQHSLAYPEAWLLA